MGPSTYHTRRITKHTRTVGLPFYLLCIVVLAALLVGCKGNDIDSLPEAIAGPGGALNCSGVPGYTIISGTPPTMNGDGSITFPGTSTYINFNAPFPAPLRAELCMTGTYPSGFMEPGLLTDNSDSLGLYVRTSIPGPGTLAVTVSEDYIGVSCSPESRSHPSFDVGQPFTHIVRVDQTGAFPVLRAWFTGGPGIPPPDVDTSDPGGCGPLSSANWTTVPNNLASLGGLGFTLTAYELRTF